MVQRTESNDSPEGSGGQDPGAHPELEDLAGQADAIGQELPGGEQPGATVVTVTNATVVAGIIDAFVFGFGLVTKLKSPAEILTHDKSTELGELWGPVFDRRGIRLHDMLGDLSDLLAPTIATVTVVVQLRAAVLLELEQRKKKKVDAQPAQVQDPAAAATPPAPAPAPGPANGGFVGAGTVDLGG